MSSCEAVPKSCNEIVVHQHVHRLCQEMSRPASLPENVSVTVQGIAANDPDQGDDRKVLLSCSRACPAHEKTYENGVKQILAVGVKRFSAQPKVDDREADVIGNLRDPVFAVVADDLEDNFIEFTSDRGDVVGFRKADDCAGLYVLDPSSVVTTWGHYRFCRGDPMTFAIGFVFSGTDHVLNTSENGNHLVPEHADTATAATIEQVARGSRPTWSCAAACRISGYLTTCCMIAHARDAKAFITVARPTIDAETDKSALLRTSEDVALWPVS